MMEHKAFAFDWDAFDADLRPLIHHSLESDDRIPLIGFVERNLGSLSDPYEGVPLTPKWRELLESDDVSTIADYCLTLYYDPAHDQGIGESWTALSDSLPDDANIALLGRTIGPASSPFDPGRMGSYFQCPLDVVHSRSTLIGHGDKFNDYLNLLSDCIRSDLGLYVTF